MLHGTYEEVDGRPAIRFERRLSHPVDRVWRAVTEPSELAHWFPSQVEVDLRPGGTMRFTFTEHELPPMEGKIEELDPPRLFAFTWGGELLRFELEPDEGDAACRLRFTHFLSERDQAARDAAGWEVCFDHLASHLGGETTEQPGTGVTPEWSELYDQYIEQGVPSGAEIPGQA